MERYDNGEIITKSRVQDEDWYGDYQAFLEFAIFNCNPIVGEMFDESLAFFKNEFNEDFSPEMKEKLLRWCVLHVERMKSKSSDE